MFLADRFADLVEHLAAAIKAAYSSRAVLISLQTLAVATERQATWGLSSAGRASALQAEGHRFDPGTLHQKSDLERHTFSIF